MKIANRQNHFATKELSDSVVPAKAGIHAFKNLTINIHQKRVDARTPHPFILIAF